MINILVEEYNKLSEQSKLIDSRKKELSKQIKEYAQKEGTKDDKGSYYSENDNYLFGSVARKSVKLNRERAETLLKSKKLWKEVVVVVEEIDENKVESLVAEDLISFEELESMTDVKTTYSVLVKPKETKEIIPEIDQVNEEKPKRGRSIFKRRK